MFTTSTQFEPQHIYRPWHIYAILECAGDFRRAAIELKRQGFGTSTTLRKKPDVHEQIRRLAEDEPGIEGCEPKPGVDPAGQAPTSESEDDKLRRLLSVRAFDPSKEPPPLRPFYSLKGIVICTPGNLTAITAQAKVGKSSFTGAMVAANIADPTRDPDLLGITAHNQDNKAVIVIDTEQAPDDFWHSIRRSQRRAMAELMPEHIFAYTVADLPVAVARKALLVAIADAAVACNGVHSVFIDGVADLVLDVNDAEECNSLVAELHSTAIRYDCSIVCIIHKNPGTDKTRGHLGSQLERKAETNLTLEKNDDVTIVFSNKQRRAPIEKKDGAAFHWDDSVKMHVSYAKPQGSVSGDLKELARLMDEVFAGKTEGLSWSELITGVIEARSTPEKTPTQRTAARWVEKMNKAELLIQSYGKYLPNPKFTL